MFKTCYYVGILLSSDTIVGTIVLEFKNHCEAEKGKKSINSVKSTVKTTHVKTTHSQRLVDMIFDISYLVDLPFERRARTI